MALPSAVRAGLMLSIVASAAWLLSGCGGQTYKCGTGTANHCYGIVEWTGSPTGLLMELTPVPLTSGDIFIDDEAWLIDYFPPTPPSEMSWVETGIENVNPTYQNGFGVTYYFWAYGLNFGGSGQVFMAYPLGAVAQSDIDAGAWIAFEINQSAKKTSRYDVSISRAATAALLYKASCSACSMTPNTILEGQELAGSSGAQAPIAFFGQNSVIQSGVTTLQTTDGSVTAGHPPNANWFPGNKPSETSNGGMFFTDCC